MNLDPCKFTWCHDCRKVKCWFNRLKNWLSIFSVLALLVGCGYLPLRPGRSSFVAGATTGQLHQSQNPKQESKQVFTRTQDGVKTTETVVTVIGASQKDTAREIGAKLASLRGVVWIGLLVFLFGIASAVWPPLKLLVGGSVTTSAVIAGAGLALVILPSLLVGHELLILCVALGAAGLWFFAHRHGGVRAELTTLKNKVLPPTIDPPK